MDCLCLKKKGLLDGNISTGLHFQVPHIDSPMPAKIRFSEGMDSPGQLSLASSITLPDLMQGWDVMVHCPTSRVMLSTYFLLVNSAVSVLQSANLRPTDPIHCCTASQHSPKILWISYRVFPVITSSASSAKATVLAPGGSLILRISSYMTFHRGSPNTERCGTPRVIWQCFGPSSVSYTSSRFSRQLLITFFRYVGIRSLSNARQIFFHLAELKAFLISRATSRQYFLHPSYSRDCLLPFTNDLVVAVWG